MKKLFFTLLFVSFVCCGFAQEKKDSTAQKNSRWSVAFNYAPNYSFYNYNDADLPHKKPIWQIFPHGQPFYKPDKFYFNNYSQNGETEYRSKINPLSFSVIFKFQATKKFIINTGLDFLQLGYIREGQMPFHASNYIKYKEISNYYHIGIPFLLGYHFKNKKYALELSTGPAIYCFFLTTTKRKWENGEVIKETGTPFKFISQKNWRTDYIIYQPFWVFKGTVLKEINKRISLNICVEFKYSFLSTFTTTRKYVNNKPISTDNFFYCTSIPVGIIYHFK